jgi:ATP-dependent Clp protease ATP-binding subunit ClpA
MVVNGPNSLNTLQDSEMFEFFTERAIMAVLNAQEEARSSGHNYLGVEQILLGLMKLGDGIAFKSLSKFDITLDKIRSELFKIVPAGSDTVGEEIPFTVRCKRVLELAWDEARLLRHNYISSEHLLLAIIREGDGVAVAVLLGLGIDLDALRRTVLEIQVDIFKAQCVSDPSNMRSFGSTARVLFFLRRYAEADDYFSKALQLPGGSFYEADADACLNTPRTMLSMESDDTDMQSFAIGGLKNET